jgi:hypothetical protein
MGSAYEEAFANALAIATHAVSSNTSVGVTVPPAPTNVTKGAGAPKLRCTDKCCCRARDMAAEFTYRLEREWPDWSDVLTPETITSLRERGLEHWLVAVRTPIYVLGVDRPEQVPYRTVPATNERIAAINDPEDRAWAILINNISARCPDTRDLILSVQDGGLVGWLMQSLLDTP